MHRVLPTTCPSCEQGWHHCHGVLLVHLDGTDECTAGTACPGGSLPHEWREPCWQLVDACCGSAFDVSSEPAVPTAA